jgi:acetyl esterase/lipase
MRIIFALTFAMLTAASLQAASATAPANVATTQEAPWVNLYPGKPPHALGEDKSDIPAFQILVPPDRIATGSAIVVCPGGGYGGLARHEGGVIGQWLAENGIAAFVLRYRLGPKYHYPVEIEDGQRAVRFVRAHAADYHVDPHRIGIIGFSAGGHLASSVATHYTAGDANAEDPVDRVSSRPDLQIVVYPVIKMTGPDAHAGSRKNLLGPEPDPKLMELFTNNKQVTKDTPPAFIVHSTTDKAVPVSNSDDYADALREAGVDYVYVRLDHGAHGFGLTDDWNKPCIDWLRQRKF